MSEPLDESAKLALLDQWLGCDARAGELLWRQRGLIEPGKCLEDLWVDWLRSYCYKQFESRKAYFFKRCWHSLDRIDQEALARECVHDWQNGLKPWNGAPGKRPGDFPAWRAFGGYLSKSRIRILTKLGRWCRLQRVLVSTGGDQDMAAASDYITLPEEQPPVTEVIEQFADETETASESTPPPGEEPSVGATIEQVVDLTGRVRTARRRSDQLLDAFFDSLKGPALKALCACARQHCETSVEVIALLESHRLEISEETAAIRDCAFEAGMTQDAYNQNTLRLRKKWRAYREREDIEPLWAELVDLITP